MSYLQIDNFLEDDLYQQLKTYSMGASARFHSIENPHDSVVYPLICEDIPKDVLENVWCNLCDKFGRDVKINTIFMRRSPFGVPVPHIAHTDNSMGLYSLMLYMNDYPEGGTAFIRHKETGMMYAPESPEFVATAEKDQNDLMAWAVVEQAMMKENRAVIFNSSLFHCAMPIGGFGDGAQARTVLTVFFS